MRNILLQLAAVCAILVFHTLAQDYTTFDWSDCGSPYADLLNVNVKKVPIFHPDVNHLSFHVKLKRSFSKSSNNFSVCRILL